MSWLLKSDCPVLGINQAQHSAHLSQKKTVDPFRFFFLLFVQSRMAHYKSVTKKYCCFTQDFVHTAYFSHKASIDHLLLYFFEGAGDMGRDSEV